MRSGALYGVFISLGILLGAFNTNLVWMVAVPTVIPLSTVSMNCTPEIELSKSTTSRARCFCCLVMRFRNWPTSVVMIGWKLYSTTVMPVSLSEGTDARRPGSPSCPGKSSG